MENRESKVIVLLDKNRIVREAFFWLIVSILLVLEDIFDGELFNTEELLLLSVKLIPSFILVQINLLLLVPKFWDKNKKRPYFCIASAGPVTFSCLIALFVNDDEPFSYNEFLDGFGYLLSLYTTLLCISSLFHFNFKYIHLKNQQLKIQQMENEKHVAELNLLKYQLNPHFLFNTLNNIYSYSLEKRPELPGMILNLSDLSSYMLHDSQVEKISIEKEVEFLKSYIQLEQLRLDNKVKISFVVDQMPANLQIPPLIFIPIVENIFKHGLNEQSESDYANIHIWHENGFLQFYSENTYSKEYEDKRKKSHTGQKNLMRRLELLYENFELDISEKESMYTVFLKIPEDK